MLKNPSPRKSGYAGVWGMNHREMRARLIASYGRFVFFPDDPEVSKIISTRAFTHLIIDEDITLYAHPVMEEQIEDELQENYDVVYNEPRMRGIYHISPYTRATNLNFKFKDGSEILKYALRKPFEEEVEIIRKMSEMLNTALAEFWNDISIGLPLEEVKAILECKILKKGIHGFLHPSIVVFGKKGRYPMPHTLGGKLEKDGILYIDSTPIFHGYPLNFSRVVFTGERREWIDALNSINSMYESLVHFVEPGLSCNMLDARIRSIGDFPHYSAVPSGGFYQPYAPGDCLLEENTLMTIVPSIYLEDGIIRVKRNLLVKKRGVEFLI